MGRGQSILYADVWQFWCDERYEVRRGSFDSYLLLLTLAGEGTIETSKGKKKCRKEEMAVIDCHEEHAYYANKKWEFLWIHFNGNHSGEIVRSLIDYQGNVVYMPETSLTYRFFNLLVFQKMGNSIAEEVRISSYLQLFLAEMMNSRDREGMPDTKKSMVNEAIGYIESNYKNKITIDEIAKFVRVSKSGFCHEFKRETGMPPYDFIVRKRLNKAKELLKTTSASVSEISEVVGFSSEANFIKTFRMKTGMTPGDFRRQINGPTDLDGVL